MSYQRVIPRDLFNEASLLKCYGRIYIELENHDLPHVQLEHDGQAFEIEQDPGSGGLSIANVQLRVGDDCIRLHRPLNSREAYPLYMTDEDECEVPLFDDKGAFTPEALDLFVSHAPTLESASRMKP